MAEVIGSEGGFDHEPDNLKNNGSLTKEQILGMSGDNFDEHLEKVFGAEGDESKAGEVGQPIETTEKPGFSAGQESVAAFLAGISAFTGVGVAAAETTSPSDANPKNGTEMVSEFKGETSSEALKGYGIKADSEVTPGPNPGPNPEATPSVLDIVTPEYIQKALDQIMDFNAPVPVEMCKNIFEAWKINTFGHYEEEFKKLGVTDEYWLEFGAKGLYAYDNSDYMTPSSKSKFQDYISRDEFIDSVVSGETENILCDEEGKPVLLLVNFTEKMDECFSAAIKKLEKNGIKNIYDSWRDSGACIFYADELQLGGGSAIGVLNQFGVVNFNMSEDNTKDVLAKGLTNQFARNSIVEPKGVAYYQRMDALGMNHLDEITGPTMVWYCEMVKDYGAYEIMVTLKDKDLKVLGRGLLGQAEYYAEKNNLSLDSDLSKRQIQLISETTEVIGKDLIKANKK